MGLLINDVEDYTSDNAEKWVLSYENYRLEKLDEMVTRFSVDIDIDEESSYPFGEHWTLALVNFKAVCEEKLVLVTMSLGGYFA